MARNRIIYASQSVWVNGEVLYRVQSLGTTTSFTSEDIFELGHLDIIDVVDDVPAVSVTLNTNDFGDVRTLATLAQILPAKISMSATASETNANLVGGAATWLHGVSLADFAITCGSLTGVTLWAPVQEECSIGTLANNIDQTLFLDELYINSLELSYSTGANATENYGAETDNKMWLLNDGKFVNYEEFTLDAGDLTEGSILLSLGAAADVATLSTGLGFLRKSLGGAPAVTWFDASTNEMLNVEIVIGTAAHATKYVYDNVTEGTQHKIYFPTGVGSTPGTDDRLQIIYSADAYASSTNNYFVALDDVTARPDGVGALRQGQVEVYILDPSDTAATDYANAWRLTSANISADLTREPLTELGHLGPYDRPLTLPIPITVTVDSTAGDLENWAKFAGKLDDYEDGTMDDINLSDLMIKDDLILCIKVFAQTDEEAGGTGANRRVVSGSELDTDDFFVDGVLDQYVGATTEQEFALKTVLIKNLKITDEGMSLDLGSNATQTFGFRATNDLYVVKGDLTYAVAVGALSRNAS